ncbi:hypothetical protein C8J56DRAFT_341277 [Mycena floridula]|nr:hypothetical protein C8J56DRAFT_341277 [Mycena floridula]
MTCFIPSSSMPSSSTSSVAGTHPHTPALTGIIAGTFSFLAVLAVFFVCLLRRRNQYRRVKMSTSSRLSSTDLPNLPQTSTFPVPVSLLQHSTESSATLSDAKIPIEASTSLHESQYDAPNRPSSPISTWPLSPSTSTSTGPILYPQSLSPTSMAPSQSLTSSTTINAMAEEMERMKSEIDWLKNQHRDVVEQLPPPYS